MSNHFLPTPDDLGGRPVSYEIERHANGSIDRYATERDEVERLVRSLTERYGPESDHWHLDSGGSGPVLVVHLTIKEE